MAMSFLIHVTQGDPSLLVFTKAVDLEGMAYTSAPTNTCMGSKHETKTHTPRRSGVCETRTHTHVQTQTDTHARTHAPPARTHTHARAHIHSCDHHIRAQSANARVLCPATSTHSPGCGLCMYVCLSICPSNLSVHLRRSVSLSV